jgi:hypothetical protein
LKQSTLEKRQIQQEVRSPLTKLKHFLETKNAVYLVVPVYASSYVFNEFAVAVYLVTGTLVLAGRKKFKLPVHLPIFSKYKYDFNNLKTVKKNNRNVPVPSAPAGVVYIGNLQSTNEQIWWDKPLSCTHLFFLATTGGGKTYSFAGILANFVIYSGFFYSDAKADLALVESYSRMMWRMGRINQLFVLSFQSGNRSPWSIQKGERISHTFNPAASASAPMISELFKSLLDGDGDIWAKRGDNLSTVLIRPLTYNRDHFNWPMGFGQIASFFTLEKLGELCGIGEGKNETYSIPQEHRKYFKPLTSFIQTLPGLTESDYEGLSTNNKALIAKITATTRDQLGYVTMQLVNVTNDLVGDYGHIFETMYGQINTEDALTNRKVVITLLPALERSESTMSVLGRISLASQKTVVANAQSFKLEGELSDHIGSRPTAADVPYASVNDEAGSYMVDGVSANTAMARSANVSFWFGGQDLQAMKKRGGMIEKEVDTIWGTTVNKMAGSVLEENTINAFINAADEEYRLEANDFEIDDSMGYKRRKSTRLTVQSRKMLTPKMLSEQDAGQVQLLTRGTVRAVSLPNFMTPGLAKPIVNFYITETLPIIPLDHSIVHSRKRITGKLSVAIQAAEKANVFELALDDAPDGRVMTHGYNRVVRFMNATMARFKHKQHTRLSLFSAECLVQFYIDEHCYDSLRHMNFTLPKIDEKHLLEKHKAGVDALFMPSTAQVALDEPDYDTETEVDSITDAEGADTELDDDFYASARKFATDASNIEAFQAELARELMDEDVATETDSGESGGESFGAIAVERLLAQQTADIERNELVSDGAFNQGGHEDGGGHGYASKVSVSDSEPEINLSLGTSEMIDISNMLAQKGISNNAPTLLFEKAEVTAEQIRIQVDDDIASLDAIRTYKPKSYSPSQSVIVDAIASLINSLNEEN